MAVLLVITAAPCHVVLGDVGLNIDVGLDMDVDDSVVGNPDSPDALIPLTIDKNGEFEGGTIELTCNYTGSGRINILNFEMSAEVETLDPSSDLPAQLWVQGTSPSDAADDVRIRATWRDGTETIASAQKTLTVVDAALGADLIKTGYEIIDPDEHTVSPLTKTVTIGCSPPGTAATFSVALTGDDAEMAELGTITRNPNAGTIDVEVKGWQGSTLESETYLEVNHGQYEVRTVSVRVVVPTTQTHAVGDSLQWANGMRAVPQLAFGSDFALPIAIQIYDQFEDPLDSIYNGTAQEAWPSVDPAGSFLDGTIGNVMTGQPSQMVNGALNDYAAFLGDWGIPAGDPITQQEVQAWGNKQIIRANAENTNNASGFHGQNGFQISEASGIQEVIVCGHHLVNKFSRNVVYKVVKDVTTAIPLVVTDNAE